MAPLLSLVLATQNEGKLSELRLLLADLPVQVLSVRDALGASLDVVEDGDTFRDNAIIKARAVCRATHMVSLADDSGLEVDALEGRPGVRSARYAHDRATDAENNEKLLRELEHVPDAQRTARFRCVLALVSPFSDTPSSVDGVCEGRIARAPRGDGGFGYDPLFIVDEASGRTMAELSDDEKNRISHRGRAMRALRPLLIQLINRMLDEAESVI
ncbi:MAG: XTP/dITP diphosphatase [Myxococcota bacterium]